MKLRKHQQELLEICSEILHGKPIKKIICNVTPGGGKSLLPVILADTLIPKIADKLLWIVPRNNLKYQGEEEFYNSIIKTEKRLRATNGNEKDPCRGLNGYITTYQAIGQNPEFHFNHLRKHKYIVFMDEPHHVSDSSSWEAALLPIIANTELLILASGTLSRSDKNKISFLNYENGLVKLKKNSETRVINYSREDAIREKSILPLDFRLMDCSAEWENQAGIIINVESIHKAQASSDALFTALRTEFAVDLINISYSKWKQYRKNCGFEAKLLIVAPNILLAQKYYNYLRKKEYCEIATSDNPKKAMESIESFKSGLFHILITVAMAYEGMSIKQITHVCCLTHIRSIPWLEQLFARANRLYEGKEKGFIFGPKDKNFIMAINKIKKLYSIEISEEQETPQSRQVDPESAMTEEERRGIRPIGSKIEINFKDKNDKEISLHVREREIKKLKNRMREHIIRTSRPGSVKAKLRIFDLTIKNKFNKKINEMTIEELDQVFIIMNHKYKELTKKK